MFSSNDFDDFFQIDSDGEVSKDSTPPSKEKTDAIPSAPAGKTVSSASSQAKPPSNKETDDSLMGGMDDFDALFESAPEQPKEVRAAQIEEKEGPSVDDLLSDFDLGAEPAPPPKPTQAKAQPKPPASAPSAADLEDLLGDFEAPAAGEKTHAGISESTLSSGGRSSAREASSPDEDLEELFSEVSEAGALAPSEGESEDDALGEGLGIEYKQRKRGIPKQVWITLATFPVLLGAVAFAMAKFTDGGFFGWKLAQKSADGYEAPEPEVLSQLADRYAKASSNLWSDNLLDYRKALSEYQAILKIDARNSPTDSRYAEVMILMNDNQLLPADRKKANDLIQQAETNHPGKLETVRAKARGALAAGDAAKADSLAKRALTIKKDDVDTLIVLGEAAFMRSDFAQAKEKLNQAISLNPKALRAKYYLALAKIQEGDTQEALVLLKDLVEGNPSHASSEVEYWNLIYVDQGRREEAKEGLRGLIETKSASLNSRDQGRSWRILAEIAETSGDEAGAIAAMEKAVERDSLNHANVYKLGKLYLDRKDYRLASQQFERASALSSTTPDYLIYYGYALRALGKYQEALVELNKGLELVPTNVVGLHQLGLTQRALDRIDQAIVSFEAVLKSDPRHIDAMIELGELYLKIDNFSMAEAQLQSAIKVNESSARARNAMGQLHLLRHKPALALQEFTIGEKNDANNPEILANKGTALVELGKLTQAQEYFQKSLAINPSRVETQVALGELYHRQGEYAKALEAYRRILDVDAKDYRTRVKLAKVLIDQQSFLDAVNELKEASKYKPDFFPTRLELGIALRGQGDLEASLEELSKAISIRPEDREAHYQMELTHLYRNDPSKAEQSMQRSLQYDPKYIAPLIALGDYFERINYYEQAAGYYKRAEKVEPKNAEVLLKIAEAYRKERNLKVAQQYYAKTLKADSKNADALVGLGLIAEDEGNQRRAVQYYQRAQKVDPNDPRSYYYLGFAYRNLNLKKAALLSFQKYLKLNPESKERKDIEDQIYHLKR